MQLKIKWLKLQKLILVTTNKDHIAYSMTSKYDNLDILYYDKLDLKIMLEDMYTIFIFQRFPCQTITGKVDLKKVF